jgi:agmatine deiminase
MIKTSLVNLVILVMAFFSCSKPEPTATNPPAQSKVLYTMPEESELHEGTWLQWPHEHQYGVTFRNRLDATWASITGVLVNSEKVHIIAYDDTEKNRITGLLNTAGVPLANIDFKIYPTDDFWIRDNGPIYVRDSSGNLVIEDWGFNAWGGKYKFENCNKIPSKIAADQSKTLIDLNATMINEGGSVEIDGHGALMATKSSILNNNRNPGMTQEKAEEIFTKYLGITKFIWLDGKAGLEITDMHIDGFARFANSSTIITMSDADLVEWQVPQHDIGALNAATNKSNTPYTFVKLPLSKNNVVTTYGKNLGYKGSYVNYYIANTRVLVPNYNDPNDAVANTIIQGLYPGRTVVGIDCRNLYANGGMIHCITQQQPK